MMADVIRKYKQSNNKLMKQLKILEHDDAHGNGNAVNQGLLREVFE